MQERIFKVEKVTDDYRFSGYYIVPNSPLKVPMDGSFVFFHDEISVVDNEDFFSVEETAAIARQITELSGIGQIRQWKIDYESVMDSLR